jgi:hypothetical protein
MDGFLTGLVIIGGTIAVFGGLVWIILIQAGYDCSARATLMQREHHYSMRAGCMIRTKQGEWVPLGAYRVVE